jgi:hypothetical protein
MYAAGKSPKTEFLLNRYSCTDFLFLMWAFGRNFNGFKIEKLKSVAHAAIIIKSSEA